MEQRRKKFRHPKWSLQANIYEVNVRQYTLEGTFEAFSKSLLRLKEMGVKILWLMPITPISKKDRQGTLGSYYAASDYTSINPEFGDLDDFINLVKEAHKLNMKVIIDFVADHTGTDHHWIVEHPEYYCWNDDKSEPEHPEGWMDVSKLNYDNDDLRKAMVKVLKYWVKEADIDGFRCDMAHLVPLDFWVEARTQLAKTKKNLFWLAETEHPEYHEAFDATYTWRWMHASEEFYQGRMNLQSLLTVLYKSVTEFPCNALRLYFTANHDENSWNGTEYEKYGDSAQLFAVFSATWNGIPLIYSGQELPNKKRLKFFDKDVIEWDDHYQLNNFYKTLLLLKSNNKCLRAGSGDIITKIISHPDDHRLFSYMQILEKDAVLVVLNCSADQLNFEVKNVKGTFRNVFGGPDVDFDVQKDLFLQPWGYLVFERVTILSEGDPVVEG
ncbi:MAG: alpha-amylase family glycosyl hydrolase [Ginsengibacter sp.]